jgi:hypothetical protein
LVEAAEAEAKVANSYHLAMVVAVVILGFLVQAQVAPKQKQSWDQGPEAVALAGS